MGCGLATSCLQAVLVDPGRQASNFSTLCWAACTAFFVPVCCISCIRDLTADAVFGSIARSIGADVRGAGAVANHERSWSAGPNFIEFDNYSGSSVVPIAAFGFCATPRCWIGQAVHQGS